MNSGRSLKAMRDPIVQNVTKYTITVQNCLRTLLLFTSQTLTARENPRRYNHQVMPSSRALRRALLRFLPRRFARALLKTGLLRLPREAQFVLSFSGAMLSLALAAWLIYQIPPVNDRLYWRVEIFKRRDLPPPHPAGTIPI